LLLFIAFLRANNEYGGDNDDHRYGLSCDLLDMRGRDISRAGKALTMFDDFCIQAAKQLEAVIGQTLDPAFQNEFAAYFAQKRAGGISERLINDALELMNYRAFLEGSFGYAYGRKCEIVGIRAKLKSAFEAALNETRERTNARRE
jgi:hypothetical protein